MRHDFRFAWRRLRKSPGFTLGTVFTLALGIGSTTAMFSLVNSVLLRPLPFPNPDRLLFIVYDLPDDTETVSYPNFFDFRAQNHSLAELASYRASGSTLTGAGDARQLETEIVSANFFRTLGIAPMLGHDFSLADEQKNRHMAMLSWDLWQSAFGGRRDIVGEIVKLDGSPHVVAGVMPRGFSFPIKTPAPELWTTLSDDADGNRSMLEQRGAGFLSLVGRLKPGVPLAQAQADLGVIARNLAAQYVKENAEMTRMVVKPELEELIGDTRPALRVLFAAVGFVLLIACVNVAGLMLARVSRRRGEIALLAAVGARRGEIVRQILMESTILSVCGGLAGVLLAAWGADALLRLVPETVPRLANVSIDATVLAFALAISIATGILSGVLAAWKMSSVEPLIALRDAGRSVTSGRGQHFAQNSLVIAETALGVTLVIGAGLLIRSFLRIESIQPGFDAHNVLTARLAVPAGHDTRIHFYDELKSQLAAIPGVEDVTASWPLPLSGSLFSISFEIEGRPTAPGHEPSEPMVVATPGFFGAMRIPIVTGREFTDADTTHSKPVMIVNQAFARKYFPGENAVGKNIKPGLGDGTILAPMREVIGVAGDVKRGGLKEDFTPQYYLPWTQAVVTWPTLVIRTSTDPAAIAGALRAKVAALNPEVPVYQLRTMQETVYRAAAEPRFQTMLLTVFAAAALLLAALGLYAVLAYMVAQRTMEIGVRMALGAQRGDILSLILGRGIVLALGGIAMGLAASAALTHELSALLYGVQPLDPATFVSVSAILLLAGLTASLMPALNAARVDPMRALRDQ
jgi:predicted permease